MAARDEAVVVARMPLKHDVCTGDDLPAAARQRIRNAVQAEIGAEYRPVLAENLSDAGPAR